MFNLSGKLGLASVITGEVELDDAIQPTAVPGLFVLSSGPIPPNPAELLGSRAFDQILEQLQEQADVLIFDTPPCLPVTDPLIVAARMDGVVLVLRAAPLEAG